MVWRALKYSLYFPRSEPRNRQREGEAPSEPASALGSHGDSPSLDVSNQPGRGITGIE